MGAKVQIKVVRVGEGCGAGQVGERPRGLMGKRAGHRRAHPPPNPPSFPQLINLEGQMGSKRGHRRDRRTSVDLK